MHALDVIFWIFFASVAAFIGWTFIRLFTETLWDRRSARKVKRPIPPGNAGSLHATTGGVQSGGDVPMSGSDYSSSITQGDLDSGDSGGGDSGGDFSGGGGESGGGGSSGSW